jgi:branched-chain amino acid transport system permease protein
MRLLSVVAYLAVTTALVLALPRSILAFLLFQGFLLVVYFAAIPVRIKAGLGVLWLFILMPVVGVINTYYLEVATQVGIFVALALGLNIVVGFAGLLDLGYVAFYAVGAYAWAIFGSGQANKFIPEAIMKFPLAPEWFFLFLAIGVIIGAITGILLGLPVLRLRGDYLAVVTLGFGEVIRVLVNNLDKPINITNGPQGITPVQRPSLFFGPVLDALGIEINRATQYSLYFYFLVIVIAGIVILVTERLDHSRIGRAWTAIREDEVAAIAMGIPLVRMKLTAFAAGASFAGAMGVLFSAKQLFVNPESFSFLQSIGVLSMVILGGMGSIPGAILGATAVTVLNLQILKALSDWLNSLRQAGVIIDLGLLQFNMAHLPVQLEPAKYERMVFGIVLVLMMIFRPEGLIPAQRRKLEVRESREEGVPGVVEAVTEMAELERGKEDTAEPKFK